jgi:hypothetical protein
VLCLEEVSSQEEEEVILNQGLCPEVILNNNQVLIWQGQVDSLLILSQHNSLNDLILIKCHPL